MTDRIFNRCFICIGSQVPGTCKVPGTYVDLWVSYANP